MTKFNRFLWTGLVLGLAACGDDVTVTNPPEPVPVVPGVTAVSVAPDGATINVGGTLGMTAAATLEPGAAAPTWAWSSSSTAIATVAGTTASATVTGVAVGSAGIRATATSGTSSASGVATVTVSTSTVTPATVSINSITTIPGGAAAELTNIANAVNVKLNLDRGGEKVTKVQLLVDNIVVGEQAFASASVEASVPELAVEELNMPWNSAEFNPTTGETKWKNGSHTISAKVITAQNAQGSAAPSIGVTTSNTSTFVPSVSITNGTTASDGLGQTWQTGDVSVTLLPVIYTAGTTTVNQVVITPGNFIQGNLPTRTLTAAPWTATWNKADLYNAASGTKGSGGVEVLGGAATNGFTLTITSTVNGNSGPSVFGASTGIRLDNVGPAAPTVNENPNGRQAGWINDAVSFTAAATGSSPDRLISVAPADQGVGGATYRGRVGTDLTSALAAAPISNAASVAPSVTGTSYCIVLFGIDALGNESAKPTACDVGDADNNTLIGVDRAAPTIAYTNASLANGARQNGGSIGGEFIVTVSDTGAVGNSGILQPIPVRSNVIRREATGTDYATAPTDCVQGVLTSSGTVCSQTTTGLVFAAPNAFTNITGITIPGYYTHSATAWDGAGNSTALAGGAVIVYDNVPVAVTNPAVPAVITGPFSAAAFINDNLSIRDYFWTVNYATGLIAPTSIDLGTPTVVDAFNAATLSNINYAVNASVSAYLALQATAGNVPQAFAGGDLLAGLTLNARDQAQAAYTSSGTTPLAPTVTTGIAISSAGPPAWTFTTFVPSTSNATICANTDPTNFPCGATPTSTVLTAVANGTTGSFNNPFSRVDFYAANAAGTRLVRIGSVPAASAGLNDNGANRAWSYALTMNAGSLYTMLGGVSPAVVGPVNVYAFGVNASGTVALVSASVAQTINP